MTNLAAFFPAVPTRIPQLEVFKSLQSIQKPARYVE